MTRPSESTKRSTDTDRQRAISRCFSQLRLTRSQCSASASDLSTVTAVNYQLKLREIILFNIGEVRSNLARQMAGNQRQSQRCPTAKLSGVAQPARGFQSCQGRFRH